jgi:signal peptidase I
VIATAPPGQGSHAAPRPRRRVLEWIAIIIVALVAAVVIKTYLVEAYVIPSVSMVPAIEVHDRVLVNKLSFDFGHHPHRGEIIVFHESPADLDPSTPTLVKRLIGLPGETLRSGPHGEIFVDNRLINQPWLTKSAAAFPGPDICSPQYNTTDCRNGVLHLPRGEYYMMGDNRGDSEDSRYWGPISGSHFIGRVFVRIWPLGRLHWF